MSISIDETNLLCGKLEAQGWRWESDQLMAPHGTMWFSPRVLNGFETVGELRERMRGRLERIRANQGDPKAVDAADWQHSLDDACSLVACLDDTFGRHDH